MKKLLTLLAILINVTTFGQVTQYLGAPTTIIESRGTHKVDSILIQPLDTLNSAPNGSTATKNGSLYWKVGGVWKYYGPPTFQQALTTGGTMTLDNVVALAGHNFTFQNGNVNIDSTNTGRTFIGGSPAIVGNLFSDLFKNRTVLGGNYTSSLATAIVTLDSTKLQVSGGTSAFTNFIKRVYYTSNETWTMTLRGKVTTIAANGGIVFGLTGTNFSIYYHLIADGGASNGKIAFQTTLGTDINLSSTAATVSAGDSILMSMTVDKAGLSGVLTDITSSTTTTTSTSFVIGSGVGPNVFNTAQPTIYFNADTWNINEWTYTDNANKNIPALFVGMSITRGFGAINYTSRYENVIFNNDYTKFQILAGPSDKITDLLNRRYEMAAYNPSYVVIDIGTNDAITGIPAYTTFKYYYMDLLSWVRRIGAIPICLNIAPRNGVTMTDYNIVISQAAALYGAKVIDIYTPLNSGGNINASYDFGDHVHLNAAGHAVVASTITAAAPELLTAGNNYAQKVNGLRSTINVPTAFQDTVSLNGPTYIGHYLPTDDSTFKAPSTEWVKRAIAAGTPVLSAINNSATLQTSATFNIDGLGAALGFKSSGSVTSTSADYAIDDFSPTITAHANSDVIKGLWIHPTLNTGGFSSVTRRGLQIDTYPLIMPTSNAVIGATGDAGNGAIQVTGGSINGIFINNCTSSGISIGGVITASGSNAYGFNVGGTLTANGNNQTFRGAYINPTFNNGAFTGSTNIGLEVAGGLTKLANGMQFDVNGSNARIVTSTATTMQFQSNNTTNQVLFQSFVSGTDNVIITGTAAAGGNQLKVNNTSGNPVLTVKGTGAVLVAASSDSSSGDLQVHGSGWFKDSVILKNVRDGISSDSLAVLHQLSSGRFVLHKIVHDGVINYLHSISTPATGGTVNLVVNQYNIINPSGTLATLTVNLPSSPSNNDVVYIKYTQAITAVTYGNGTVVDGITAPSAGGLIVLVYDAGTTSWY